MVETIISPDGVLASSDVFYSWTPEGFKDPLLWGSIRFTSHDILLSMFFPLSCRDALYYCNTDVYTIDQKSCLCPLSTHTNSHLHHSIAAAAVKIQTNYPGPPSQVQSLGPPIWLPG
jgi:hypothetical protein